MKTNTAAIDDFFAATGEREADMRSLDALIRKTAPLLTRSLFSSPTIHMLAYGMTHYHYASGREGDWPAVGLANQKHYISLYVCAVRDGAYIAEANADALGKVSVGKSCIRFKTLAGVDIPTLERVLRETEAWYQTQEKPA